MKRKGLPKTKRINFQKEISLLPTEKAREAFFFALENPSPPNHALIAAFKKHGELKVIN